MMMAEPNVDETLFGRRNSGRSRKAGSAIVNGMRSSRSVVDPGPNAAFISKSYLDEIRARAQGRVSVEHHPPTPARHPSAPQAEMRKTRIRRANQRQLEREAAAAARAEVSKEELLQTISLEKLTNPALAAAHENEVEEYDEIKAFNVKMGKARAMLEVEGQVVDKRQRKQKETVRIARIEKRMERDRRIALQKEIEIVEEKRRLEKEAADLLQRQLEKRAFERLIEEERLELEGQQMKAAIQAALREEERQAELKRERSKQIMVETLKANAEHQKLKAARKAKEIAQDKALARYQRKKEREEIARQEAEEAKRQERERLFAKMRAEQERIMDNRGEEDARRAAKHQEERILAERRAEAEKEAQRKALYEEVVRDRELQKQFKREKARREAEKEKLQARLAAIQLKQAVAQEKAEYEAKIAKELAHQQDVLDEIERREETRRAAAQIKFREREAVAKKEAERAIRIKMMKEKKLKELAEEGIGFEAQVQAGLHTEKSSLW